jgi:hypothetical protein
MQTLHIFFDKCNNEIISDKQLSLNKQLTDKEYFELRLINPSQNFHTIYISDFYNPSGADHSTDASAVAIYLRITGYEGNIICVGANSFDNKIKENLSYCIFNTAACKYLELKELNSFSINELLPFNEKAHRNINKIVRANLDLQKYRHKCANFFSIFVNLGLLVKFGRLTQQEFNNWMVSKLELFSFEFTALHYLFPNEVRLFTQFEIADSDANKIQEALEKLYSIIGDKEFNTIIIDDHAEDGFALFLEKLLVQKSESFQAISYKQVNEKIRELKGRRPLISKYNLAFLSLKKDDESQENDYANTSAYSAIKAIKLIEPNTRVPILLYTASNKQHVLSESLLYHLDDEENYSPNDILLKQGIEEQLNVHQICNRFVDFIIKICINLNKSLAAKIAMQKIDGNTLELEKQERLDATAVELDKIRKDKTKIENSENLLEDFDSIWLDTNCVIGNKEDDLLSLHWRSTKCLLDLAIEKEKKVVVLSKVIAEILDKKNSRRSEIQSRAHEAYKYFTDNYHQLTIVSNDEQHDKNLLFFKLPYIRYADKDLVALLTKEADGKVAESILFICNDYGTNIAPGPMKILKNIPAIKIMNNEELEIFLKLK